MTSTRPNAFADTVKGMELNKKEQTLLATGNEHWNSSYQAQSRLDHGDLHRPQAQEGVSARGRRPDWSYHKGPYQVDIDIGTTEYQKKVGTLGQLDLQGKENEHRQLLQDDLKDGTTQNTKHIPGYQGYLPHNSSSNAAYQQGLGLETR